MDPETGSEEATMSASTLHDTLPAVDAHRASPMNLAATGWALTTTLVGLFVLCYLAALAMLSLGLAHGWVSLFATQPDHVARTFAEGVIGSATGA
jgi:hypothetical protein